MVEITDIEKLAPELLKKSLAQLEREITERRMAIDKIQHAEEVKAKEALADEANRHIDAVTAGVKFLHDNGILSEKIASAFSRADGTFNPATFLRHVTADQLVPRAPRARRARDPNAPKRHRRTKAEIEALKAAGEYKPRRRA